VQRPRYDPGVSSRLAVDARGRLIVVVTVPQPGLVSGDHFLVLGNEIPVAEPARFTFVGTRTGRPALPADAPARNGNGTNPGARSSPRKWTDEHRAEARRLQAEGLSWSQVAERVCGDKRFKSTVQLWLRPRAVETAQSSPSLTAASAGSPSDPTRGR